MTSQQKEARTKSGGKTEKMKVHFLFNYGNEVAFNSTFKFGIPYLEAAAVSQRLFEWALSKKLPCATGTLITHS